MVGGGLTVMMYVQDAVQLFALAYVYVIVCVPAPAVAGLNWPALTPVPLYVPPVGEPPVNANAGASIHTEVLDGQLTTGSGFTVIVYVQAAVQLFALVYKYVIVCAPAPAVAGLNWPALTPVPLYVPPMGEPPVRAKAGASIHTDVFAGQVTTGSGLTVIVYVQEAVQLFASV